MEGSGSHISGESSSVRFDGLPPLSTSPLARKGSSEGTEVIPEKDRE